MQTTEQPLPEEDSSIGESNIVASKAIDTESFDYRYLRYSVDRSLAKDVELKEACIKEGGRVADVLRRYRVSSDKIVARVCNEFRLPLYTAIHRSPSGDLEERLEEIETERSQYQRRLDGLAEKEQQRRILLEAEDIRWGAQYSLTLAGTLPINNHHLLPPYSRFAVEALQDGRVRSLGELKRLAKDMGLDFSGKSPGRTLHKRLDTLVIVSFGIPKHLQNVLSLWP